MKGRWRWIWLIMIANLAVCIILVFAYPHLMVSPGKVSPGHASFETDCFACHAPLRGASAERCLVCHALPDIGLRTTKGEIIKYNTVARTNSRKVAFHQELIEQNCIACHSDHADPKLTQHSRKPFSHALLRPATQKLCETCHARPSNKLHDNIAPAIGCAQCHQTNGWKPANFDHALLPKEQLSQCHNCHKAPSDKLHRQIKGDCGQCHSTKAWEPATFEHSKFFVLDGDHNTTCATCHTTDNYKEYTCYGCHEHTLENIKRKHTREGIRNFDNCVKCHRSAEGEREGGEGGEGGEHGERD